MATELNKDFLDEINSELSNIPDLIDKYRKLSLEYKEHLSLNAKTIGEANKEQPAWFSYYDERRVELHKISQLVESCVARVKGKLWTTLQKNNQYNAGVKDLEHEVRSNKHYYEYYKIQLEIEELYELYCSITKSFEQRGYTLKNLTELVVHSMENDIL